MRLKFKLTLALFVASISTASTSQAYEWIIEDPKINLLENSVYEGMLIRRVLDFDGKTFVAVTVKEDLAVQTLSTIFGTEKITPDFSVGLPKDVNVEIAEDNPNEPVKPSPKSAWHVEEMKYSSLPRQTDGRGVIVAILDTGVTTSHPNIPLWTNKGEIPGNGLDDDGNGYIDDIHGYDFVSERGDMTQVGAHGTHCAGIVAASPYDVKLPNSARGVAEGLNPATSDKRACLPFVERKASKDTLIRRNHAAFDLITLHRLEQSFEIPLAKAIIFLALNKLKEDRSQKRPRKDLQEQSRITLLCRPVQKNAPTL